MNNHKNVLPEATNENIERTFEKIKTYAAEKGYRISGDLKIPANMLGIKKSLAFDSQRKLKMLRKYIARLDKKVTMAVADCFLHFLFKRGYSMDKAPEVMFSEKEVKIKQARASWKKAAAEAEKLRKAYREEKGDFYRKMLKNAA